MPPTCIFAYVMLPRSAPAPPKPNSTLQLRIYEDDDGSRKEEIAELGATNQSQLYT